MCVQRTRGGSDYSVLGVRGPTPGLRRKIAPGDPLRHDVGPTRRYPGRMQVDGLSQLVPYRPTLSPTGRVQGKGSSILFRGVKVPRRRPPFRGFFPRYRRQLGGGVVGSRPDVFSQYTETPDGPCLKAGEVGESYSTHNPNPPHHGVTPLDDQVSSWVPSLPCRWSGPIVCHSVGLDPCDLRGCQSLGFTPP